MMQIESFKAPFVRPRPKVALRIALMPTRKERIEERLPEEGRASEIRSESIKADFARKVERVDDATDKGIGAG